VKLVNGGRAAFGRILLLLVLMGGAPLSTAAQEGEPRSTAGPLLGTTDLYLGLGAALGTVALAPLDARIAEAFRDGTDEHPAALRLAVAGTGFAGGPGTLVLAGSLFVTGKVVASSDLATAGIRTAEAIVVAELLVYGIKGLAGRARPRVPGAGPLDFQLGRGIAGGAYQSFPSGHTAAAFATAAVLTGVVGEHHPDSRVLVGSLLYSGATLTGLSRIYHNEHWLSDIAMGAAIGAYSGWKVMSFHRDRPDGTRLDRFLLSVSIAGGRPVGFAITPAP
jgi:membrane-associated phospholipid phosphatase